MAPTALNKDREPNRNHIVSTSGNYQGNKEVANDNRTVESRRNANKNVSQPNAQSTTGKDIASLTAEKYNKVRLGGQEVQTGFENTDKKPANNNLTVQQKRMRALRRMAERYKQKKGEITGNYSVRGFARSGHVLIVCSWLFFSSFIWVIIYMAAFGLEVYTDGFVLLDMIVPADYLGFAAWMITIFINTVIAFVSITLFFLSRMNPLSGKNLPGFIVLYVLSLTPFVNLFPWLAIWIALVGGQRNQN